MFVKNFFQGTPFVTVNGILANVARKAVPHFANQSRHRQLGSAIRATKESGSREFKIKIDFALGRTAGSAGSTRPTFEPLVFRKLRMLPFRTVSAKIEQDTDIPGGYFFPVFASVKTRKNLYIYKNITYIGPKSKDIWIEIMVTVHALVPALRRGNPCSDAPAS